MKNKVKKFPHPPGQDVVPTNKPLIIFALGKKRVAIQWIVTELQDQPAEVIPIQDPRQRKDGNITRRPQ